jgi:hypothetical protein
MATKNNPKELLKPLEGDDEIQALFEELTGDKADRQFSTEKPLYVQAAEQRAAQMGISGDELMADYAHRVKDSRYPTPDCLRADAVQAQIQGVELSEEQIDHVKMCSECRDLIDACQPSEAAIASLLEEVRSMAVLASAENDVPELKDATSIESQPQTSQLGTRAVNSTESIQPCKEKVAPASLTQAVTIDNIYEASLLQASVSNAWTSLDPTQRSALFRYVEDDSAQRNAFNQVGAKGRIAMETLRIHVERALEARHLPTEQIEFLCSQINEKLVRKTLVSATCTLFPSIVHTKDKGYLKRPKVFFTEKKTDS